MFLFTQCLAEIQINNRQAFLCLFYFYRPQKFDKRSVLRPLQSFTMITKMLSAFIENASIWKRDPEWRHLETELYRIGMDGENLLMHVEGALINLLYFERSIWIIELLTINILYIHVMYMKMQHRYCKYMPIVSDTTLLKIPYFVDVTLKIVTKCQSFSGALFTNSTAWLTGKKLGWCKTIDAKN